MREIQVGQYKSTKAKEEEQIKQGKEGNKTKNKQ
jgi:hypothetical protein